MDVDTMAKYYSLIDHGITLQNIKISVNYGNTRLDVTEGSTHIFIIIELISNTNTCNE